MTVLYHVSSCVGFELSRQRTFCLEFFWRSV